MSDLSAILPEWRNLSLDELAQKLATLPKEARDEIVSAAYSATEHMRWLPSPGPQLLAYHSQADLLLYGGSGGAGKLQPLTAKVLTPMGWKLMGDIRVGDQISDPSTGGATRVISTLDHARKPIYRLTFDDGATTEAGDEHLWAYHVSGGARARRKKSDQREWARAVLGLVTPRDRWHHFRIGTTKDLEKILHKGHEPRIPLSEPLLFSINGRTGHGAMPPYLAGIMMGDGHHGSLTVTSCDDEVRDYLLSIGFFPQSELHTDGKPKSYVAAGQIRKSADAWLRNHGLRHCRSWEKFIPDYVFTADIKYRIEFLRGLMDTDGTIDDRGHPSYTSTSRRLADGVADLVRGFGGKATITEKRPTFTHKGEKKDGRLAFNIYIWLPNTYAFFKIERKKARCISDWNGGAENMRALRSIEKVRDDAARCITVDSPYGLYVTDDYIVTHNSDLLLGLAATAHKKSLIMRAQFNDLDALTERAIEINGTKVGFNGSPPPSLRTVDGRFIQFTGAALEKWQGQPFDFKGWDEGAQIQEQVIKFHLGWIRTTDPNQRARGVIATNPPVNSQGDWLIGMFRPWLDLTHENPASPGELRFYVKTPDGKDFEVPDATPYQFPGQTDVLRPQSRTFIPGKLRDNPYLARTNYQATLDSLEEPLRSAIRDGNFMASRADQENQVIPTAWILEANKRWTKEMPDFQMTAIGLDVGAGGADRVVLAARYNEWYAPLVTVPGKDAPDGSKQAALVVLHRRDNAGIVVDVGGGYGGDVCGRLEANGIKPQKFDGSAGSLGRAKDGSGRIFVNKRAEAWWRFREALNPDQAGGALVALPDDPELRAELSSVRFIPDVAKIQIEDKKEVRKRLGRSPDKADAVVMAWAPGDVAVKRVRFGGGAGGSERPARGNLGFSDIKRRFGQ